MLMHEQATMIKAALWCQDNPDIDPIEIFPPKCAFSEDEARAAVSEYNNEYVIVRRADVQLIIDAYKSGLLGALTDTTLISRFLLALETDDL